MDSIFDKLSEEAKRAIQFSYSPYSNFKVAAVVEMEDGSIFSGSNVENASYGLTICAERNAIFQAVSKGHRLIKNILIYSTSLTVRTGPCGACRQVIKEFADDRTLIIGACASEDKLIWTMEDLLPQGFGPNNLLKKKENLENRHKKAIDQLHSLSNESVHREHGCPYAEINYEDLDEVIAILEGKND